MKHLVLQHSTVNGSLLVKMDSLLLDSEDSNIKHHLAVFQMVPYGSPLGSSLSFSVGSFLFSIHGSLCLLAVTIAAVFLAVSLAI